MYIRLPSCSSRRASCSIINFLSHHPCVFSRRSSGGIAVHIISANLRLLLSSDTASFPPPIAPLSSLGGLSLSLLSSFHAPATRLCATIAAAPKFRSPGLHLEPLDDKTYCPPAGRPLIIPILPVVAGLSAARVGAYRSHKRGERGAIGGGKEAVSDGSKSGRLVEMMWTGVPPDDRRERENTGMEREII